MTQDDNGRESLFDRLERRRRAAATAAEKREAMRIRHRRRMVRCVIPECDRDTYRAQQFPICQDHLLAIWQRVEGIRLNPKHFSSDLFPKGVVEETPEEQQVQRIAAQRKELSERDPMGTLYVLDTRDGLVKIGWTKNLESRMSQYPPTFRLIVCTSGRRSAERDAHRALRNSRVKKREWYEVTPEVVRLINTWIAERNMHEAQRAARAREVTGVMRHLEDTECRMIPRFTSLDEWVGPALDEMGYWKPKRPAPKGKTRAARLA